MFLAINAQFFHDRVPPQFVASQSPSYSNPADLTSGSNVTLAATGAQPVLDPGPARIWGFTHPAPSAVLAGTVIPGVGVGIAASSTDKLDIICAAVTEILAILRKTPHEGSGYHKIVNGLGKPIHIRIDPPDDK